MEIQEKFCTEFLSLILSAGVVSN